MSDRLVELEAQVDTWVQWRQNIVTRARARIAEAEQAITEANQVFDERVLPLQRELGELRPKIAAPTRQAPPLDPDPEWSEEDQRHYRELLEGK